MEQLTTGNAIVDAVSKINFQGDITPRIWRKTITKANGKPYALARDILSDLVYWYRAMETVDEETQKITMKKKFRDDLLFKTYEQLGEEFGESKRVIRDALKRLEELGVICRHFRTVQYDGGMIMNNVMYIELIPSVLYALTYPEAGDPGEDNAKTTEMRDPSPPGDKNVTRVVPDGEREIPPGDENVTRVVTDLSPYTESTTENTSKYYNTSPCQSVREDHDRKGEVCVQDRTDGTEKPCSTDVFLHKIHQIRDQSEQDEMTGYREIQSLKQEFLQNLPGSMEETYPMPFLKEWYDYKSLVNIDPKRIDAVMEILYDALNSDRKMIRIRGEDKPASVVKGKLLKLAPFDIKYAIEKYDSQTTRIRNQQAYLLTLLYLAKEQQELDVSNRVQHDLYGKKEGDETWQRKS